jgi:hypothetical protein
VSYNTKYCCTKTTGVFYSIVQLVPYVQMDGRTLLGNVLRVDRANERKERPAFDSRPPSRYEGEPEVVGV